MFVLFQLKHFQHKLLDFNNVFVRRSQTKQFPQITCMICLTHTIRDHPLWTGLVREHVYAVHYCDCTFFPLTVYILFRSAQTWCPFWSLFCMWGWRACDINRRTMHECPQRIPHYLYSHMHMWVWIFQWTQIMAAFLPHV